MKHYLLFLLAFLSIGINAQTANGTETKVNYTSRMMNPQTVTTIPTIATMGADGTIGRGVPENLSINQPPHPINYTTLTPTLGGHLIGIDTRLGQIGQTTAGQTQRIYWTGDNVTVNAVDYFASSATGKGSTPSASPTSLVNGDNQKQYFTKDIISIAQPANTLSAPGTYAGQLSVMVDSDIAQERFTVDVYKTNNLGVPIASGITGAPVGDLGVTVIAILDSGVLDLSANALTNITISGVLLEQLTLNTGERVRYHVSGAKVGTAGSNVTFTVYYGSNHSSYYDVPVTTKASGVINDSEDTPGLTTADALDYLNSKIPTSFSKIVYVNNNNPNSATIFDLNNPPTVNDDLLKTDVANLYIGLDASTWVYNGSIYVTKTVPVTPAVFNYAGTTIPAANTTSSISRTGSIASTNGFVKTGATISDALLAGGGTLSNPVSGTGVAGRVAFWSGSGALSSDITLLFNTTTKALTATSFLGVATSSNRLNGIAYTTANTDVGSAGLNAIFNIGGSSGFPNSMGVGIDVRRSVGTSNSSNGTFQIWSSNVASDTDIMVRKVNNYSAGEVWTAFKPLLQGNSLTANTIPKASSAGQLTNSNITDNGTTVTIGGNVNITGATASTVAGFDVSKNLVSLATATYPSLTELSYVKGVTSSVQTQINNLSTPKITITTAVSITTATNDAGGLGQNGRHVVIDNGANVINLTCNGSVTASYGKVGTGAITFVQGSGRTLVQLSGTAVFNGIAGSTATLWSNGTTDYLSINNY